MRKQFCLLPRTTGPNGPKRTQKAPSKWYLGAMKTKSELMARLFSDFGGKKKKKMFLSLVDIVHLSEFDRWNKNKFLINDSIFWIKKKKVRHQ